MSTQYQTNKSHNNTTRLTGQVIFFQNHDHHQGNLMKECRCGKQITIAILAIILSKQFRYNNNRQTFHSHDHQADNSLGESRHDNCLTGHDNSVQTIDHIRILSIGLELPCNGG